MSRGRGGPWWFPVIYIIIAITFLWILSSEAEAQSHILRFHCKNDRHKIVEVGYFKHGFYKKRKQNFIKHYHINKGWTRTYCNDGYFNCKAKMRPTLVKTEYVSERELEKHSVYLEDQCTHTFTIKNGKLKHAKSKRYGYTY